MVTVPAVITANTILLALVFGFFWGLGFWVAAAVIGIPTRRWWQQG